MNKAINVTRPTTNIIKRLDFDNTEYEFELSSASYQFMQACCSAKLDTPNKVVRELARGEECMDTLDTADKEIVDFIWVASKLGDITSKHELDTLIKLTIYVDTEISIDLSGFPNLRELRVYNWRHSMAPKQNIGLVFPSIHMGYCDIEDISFCGFIADHIDLSQLDCLEYVTIFVKGIKEISQVSFHPSDSIKKIYFDGTTEVESEMFLAILRADNR